MDISANDGLEFSLMQFNEEASRQSEDFIKNHPVTMSNNSTGSPHPIVGHSVRDFEMQLTELR